MAKFCSGRGRCLHCLLCPCVPWRLHRSLKFCHSTPDQNKIFGSLIRLSPSSLYYPRGQERQVCYPLCVYSPKPHRTHSVYQACKTQNTHFWNNQHVMVNWDHVSRCTSPIASYSKRKASRNGENQITRSLHWRESQLCRHIASIFSGRAIHQGYRPNEARGATL